MSSVVSRYGNKNLTTALMRSTPRIVVLAGVGAIAAEWAGSGFIDFVWGSLNRGKSWEDLYKQIKRRQQAENPAATQATTLQRNVA